MCIVENFFEYSCTIHPAHLRIIPGQGIFYFKTKIFSTFHVAGQHGFLLAPESGETAAWRWRKRFTRKRVVEQRSVLPEADPGKDAAAPAAA
jgi:hypothetical protein